MGVKYTGALRDYSGYGEAGRHDVMALIASGVDLTCEIPVYVREFADFGYIGRKISKYEARGIDYNIKILHVTPNVYRQYMELGKYHIARAFWETDKLPEEFVQNINLCNEAWTGSQYNKDAMIRSGVKVPIYIIPQAIDVSINVPPFPSEHQDTYKFYSVFEYTERKNPKALLRAYFEEFTASDNVSLTLKTYLDDHSTKKRDEIISEIVRIKRDYSNPAPLYICNTLMNREEIYRLHKSHDCFISTHRGEGWGIPQAEALLTGNIVISTNCGGIHEYLEHKKTALLIPYTLTKLTQNNRNQQWYKNDQKWADVKVEDVRELMRYAYKYHKSLKLGERARQHMIDTFNFDTVGKLMMERIEAI